MGQLFDPNIDYYSILHVQADARQEAIKRAYYAVLKLRVHPDHGGNHEDAVRVNLAYQVLSNPQIRQAYDAARRRYELARQAQAHPQTARQPQPQRQQHGRPSRARPRHAAPHESVRTVAWPHCCAQNRLPGQARACYALCCKCGGNLDGRTRQQAYDLLVDKVALPSHYHHRLQAAGELHLQRTYQGISRRFHCMRCQYEWYELSPNGLPTVCPRCRSHRWNEFRLFQCRHCGHRFSSSGLYAWPYRLFAECPSCRKAHWHSGCERNPIINLLRWMGAQLNRLVR